MTTYRVFTLTAKLYKLDHGIHTPSRWVLAQSVRYFGSEEEMKSKQSELENENTRTSQTQYREFDMLELIQQDKSNFLEKINKEIALLEEEITLNENQRQLLLSQNLRRKATIEKLYNQQNVLKN